MKLFHSRFSTLRVSLHIMASCALAVALLFAVSPMDSTFAQTEPTASDVVESRDVDAASLKFISAGHVLLFEGSGVMIASTTHMLRTEFLDANRVVPMADAHTTVAASTGAAAPLGRVTYAGLWDGVDVVYEASEGTIAKSTYYLADGALVEAIRLGYNRRVSLDDDGNLLVAFEAGTLVESAPIAWQETPEGRSPVHVSWVLQGEHEVGFALGSYLPNVPVVIDPWLTFLGGTGSDRGYGVAVDGAGNVYVTGYSNATWGDPVRELQGSVDAFAAKLDSTGELVWNTFLGGGSPDFGNGIAVDVAGNVYVIGQSYATWGSPLQPYQGSEAAFAAKLDSDGSLIWNTFLGAGYDTGEAIAVDSEGNVYVAGNSSVTWGDPVRGHQGNAEGFAAKLDGNGGLVWNTFLGGAAGDYLRAIAVGGDGNVYVAGHSSATWGDDPVREYADDEDAFAAKLDGSGNLTWNTFLGGSGYDTGYAIAVDGNGNVYVAGSTSYGSWGAPVQPYQGSSDAFAAKLDGDGNLTWNTFLGGGSSDYGHGVVLDGDGSVYVVGHGYSTWGSPVREYQGDYDAFAAKLDGSGTLTWNTFLGGGSSEYAHGVVVDSSGNVYVAGYSQSTWGYCPVRAYSAGEDAFVVQIDSNGSIQPEGIELVLKEGWNMVSVPLAATGRTPTQVFGPTAVVYAWDAANGKYINPPTIEPGMGYWVKSTYDHTHFICGTLVDSVTFDAAEGWNMIGAPDTAVPLADLADYDCLLLDHVYWWDPGANPKEYVALGADEYLEPGKAYWIVSTAGCSITLPVTE